jgi:hypothetical protein
MADLEHIAAESISVENRNLDVVELLWEGIKEVVQFHFKLPGRPASVRIIQKVVNWGGREEFDAIHTDGPAGGFVNRI